MTTPAGATPRRRRRTGGDAGDGQVPRHVPQHERATTALARPVLLGCDAFSAAAGLHPEHVRRLVALGLLDPFRDAAGGLWFPPAQVAAAARLQRLRAGLGLNYAALGLVIDLLDRIDDLERELRRRQPIGALT
ncbi:MAG TPA: chaperone modulator CbpM [Acidimicrobiales bacterium]|nr:chaperone modulator CbpM [Acidimicrobiales bacterium]